MKEHSWKNVCLKPQVLLLLSTLAGWMNRKQQMAIEYLLEENRVLREQLGDKRIQFTDTQRKRLARKGRLLGLADLRKVATLVKPETILSWHRRLIALKYTAKKRVTVLGRRKAEIRALIIRISQENPTWGYRRIVGALSNLGIRRSREAVAQVLRKEGIRPDPGGKFHLNWHSFIASHMDVLAATDFFTTEVWTLRGLVRYHIHFVIDMATRKVKVTHISCQWCGRVMEQVARQMVDAIDGPLLSKRYLIMDRDPLYTTAVRKVLTDAGINLVRCPPQKPVVNIYAERFVKSIKNECMDKLIFFGDKSLRYAISEYIEHYNSERNHQGISNKLIDPKLGTTTEEHDSDIIDFQELIVRSGRLGGLLNFYQRKAA